MDIGSISVKDLMSEKLETLLNEIQAKVRNRNFAELDRCVAELAKIGENIVVKTNAEGQRVATVEARNGDVIENIDFMSVLQQLREKFDTRVSTTPGQRNAMKAYRENVEKTIGTLLRENTITQELLSRGVSDRDIINNGENEIQRSKDKVESLKPSLKVRKELRDLFGVNSYIETARRWDSKSDVKQIEDANVANEKLNLIKTKLTEMKDFADGLGDLDARDRAENEREIARLLSEVNTLKVEVKDLQIQGLNISSLDRINQFNAAEIQNKINTIPNANASKDEAINRMKNVIRNNPDKFTSYLPNGVAPDSLTEKQLLDMIKKINEEIKTYTNEIRYEEVYQTTTSESVERYKEAAERSRVLGAKFELVPVRVNIPKYKVATIMDPVTNPDGTPTIDTDGNPITRARTDGDGHELKAIYEYDETTGTYRTRKEFTEFLERDELETAVRAEVGENWNTQQVTVDSATDRVHAPTAETRQSILGADGIEEASYIQRAKDTARNTTETAMSILSAAQKREIIRREYRREPGWHPIKFLRSQFAPNSMWEEYGANHRTSEIASAETRAETEARAELDTKVRTKIAPEIDEYQRVNGITTVTRRYVMDELGKAASRNRVLYNVQEGTDVETIKQSAVRAATVMGLTYEQLYIGRCEGTLSPEDFAREVRELKAKEEVAQSRAYTDDLRNPQRYGRGHKDTFKDDEER